MVRFEWIIDSMKQIVQQHKQTLIGTDKSEIVPNNASFKAGLNVVMLEALGAGWP